ncbi:MAG: histidine phosphatase family protein [Oscillospiraceae bacterium]|nr:histidine phosphatase family protein [Oscillospiraceae bacterium]
MKLYVARHGQTQMNADNQVCGRTDIPLTALGLQQAQQLADNARGKEIDIIIVSPMIRARQTAQAVADRYNLPVIIDDRLIEQNFGIYEGVDRKDPRFLAGKRQLAARHPGGESMFQVAQRVYNLLDEVKEKYPDKNVLLVCHGGMCRIIRTYFEDLDTETFAGYSPDNASLAEYEI